MNARTFVPPVSAAPRKPCRRLLRMGLALTGLASVTVLVLSLPFPAWWLACVLLPTLLLLPEVHP